MAKKVYLVRTKALILNLDTTIKYLGETPKTYASIQALYDNVPLFEDTSLRTPFRNQYQKFVSDMTEDVSIMEFEGEKFEITISEYGRTDEVPSTVIATEKAGEAMKTYGKELAKLKKRKGLLLQPQEEDVKYVASFLNVDEPRVGNQKLVGIVLQMITIPLAEYRKAIKTSNNSRKGVINSILDGLK